MFHTDSGSNISRSESSIFSRFFNKKSKLLGVDSLFCLPYIDFRSVSWYKRFVGLVSYLSEIKYKLQAYNILIVSKGVEPMDVEHIDTWFAKTSKFR